MDLFESTYYNLTKTLMSIVGIWPYQEAKERIVRVIISYGVLCITLSTVIIHCCTIKFDINEIVDTLTFLVPNLSYFVSYVTLQCSIKKVKTVFDWIKSNWGILEKSEEIDIMKKYATKSKNITIIMAVIFCLFISLVIFAYTLPSLLDIILPLNETRKRECSLPIKLYHNFQDTTAGFMFTILFTIILGLIAVSVYSFFFLMIYHSCGMFSITGYDKTKGEASMNSRIRQRNHATDNTIGRMIALADCRIHRIFTFRYKLEHAFDENDKYICTNKEYEMFREKIVQTIRFHIRAIKFLECLKDTSEVCYSLQIALALILVAIAFIKIMMLNKEALGNNMVEISAYFVHFNGTMFALFISCHASQEIINHSIDVFYKAAVAPWYLASKRTQTLAILILMRSQAPCYLGVGKTFVSSYEFFASLLKTSMSYATVSYATMQ